jgi:hypothetical protein
VPLSFLFMSCHVLLTETNSVKSALNVPHMMKWDSVDGWDSSVMRGYSTRTEVYGGELYVRSNPCHCMIFEKKSILHSMEKERNEISFLQNANYCKQQRQVFVEKHGMQRTIHKKEVK